MNEAARSGGAHVMPSAERRVAPPATRTIVLAGGGSGGHISPGLAIAERLRELDPGARPVFACSVRAIDATMLSEANASYSPIPATPFGLRPMTLWRFLGSFPRARRRAELLLREWRADHVVALGGFVAAPVVAAAQRLGLPVMLVNLDARPGRANRWVSRRATTVLSAVPIEGDARFARRVEAIVGMPLRRIAIAPADAAECRRRLGLDPQIRTLLVTGASQGSVSLNRFMAAATRAMPTAFAGWQVLHLTGAEPIDALVSTYRNAGVRAVVLPFLHRIGCAWGAANAALSRAGANSVAEAAANAVPTLFLPYPHHRDLHQRHNARPLVDAGGALMADDLVDAERNVAAIGPVLDTLLTDDARRTAMHEALKALAPPDAAADIARRLLATHTRSA